MGWKSWAYSGLLLMLLLIVGLLTSRGIVKSVVNQGDIHLEADAIEYFQGDTITFLGTLDFTGDEQAAIRRVALVLTGASVVEIDLPLEEGVHTLSGAPEFGGELQVAVSYQQISLLPTPTGTPGGQFKGIFQGVDNDAEIILRINWGKLANLQTWSETTRPSWSLSLAKMRTPAKALKSSSQYFRGNAGITTSTVQSTRATS